MINRLYEYIKINQSYKKAIKECNLEYIVCKLPKSIYDFKIESFIYNHDTDTVCYNSNPYWYVCVISDNTLFLTKPYEINNIIYEYYKTYIDKLIRI